MKTLSNLEYKETSGTSLYNHSSYQEIPYCTKEALEVVALKVKTSRATVTFVFLHLAGNPGKNCNKTRKKRHTILEKRPACLLVGDPIYLDKSSESVDEALEVS